MISKTGVGDFFAGTTGSYALNVRNVGLGATVETGGITVRDVLPPSLTYISANAPGRFSNRIAKSNILITYLITTSDLIEFAIKQMSWDS